MKRHLESHAKEKKYKCPHCPRLFDLPSFLRRHVKIFHVEWQFDHKPIESIMGKVKTEGVDGENPKMDVKDFAEFKQDI